MRPGTSHRGELLVAAAALPIIFLHTDWQPSLSVDAGSTSAELRLSDVAVLAVAAAALAAGRRRGFGPLREGRWIWLAAAGLLAWILVATLYGPAVLDGYPLAKNLVNAAKFVEYALLAPSIALLVRDRDDLRPLVLALVAWSCAATVVGLAQFLGADILDGWGAGRRQPSFLGHHDFAALSGAAFVYGLASLVRQSEERTLLWIALAAGGLGLVLAAAVASVLGLGLALAVLAALAFQRRPRRAGRTLAAVALTGVVTAGIFGLRGGDVVDFVGFAGKSEPPSGDVETYAHRTVLAYIGTRIFLDHPFLGVGWQGSSELAAFEPHLDEARARFPDASPLAFPSEERRYGVQNAYVQALADMGVLGLVLLAALFVTGALVAARAALRGSGIALLGLLWLLLVAGLWAAQGLVAGLPMTALTWIALGLAAAGGPASEGDGRSEPQVASAAG